MLLKVMANEPSAILFRLEVKLPSGEVIELPVDRETHAGPAAAAFAKEHCLPESQQRALQRSIDMRLHQHKLQAHQQYIPSQTMVPGLAEGSQASHGKPQGTSKQHAAFDSANQANDGAPDSPTLAARRLPADELSAQSRHIASVTPALGPSAGPVQHSVVDVSSKRLHDASVTGVLSLLCANANDSATCATELIVDMQYNNVSSVVHLANGLSSNVVELRAGHNNLSGSLAPLAALSSLHTLQLPGNALTELNGLSLASHLVHLDVSGNRVVSLAGLEGARSLASLDVRNNMIASLQALRPLSHCPSLQHVQLGGNPICPPEASAPPEQPLALEGTPCLHPAVRKYRSRVLALLPTLVQLDGLRTAPSSVRYRDTSPRRASSRGRRAQGGSAAAGATNGTSRALQNTEHVSTTTLTTPSMFGVHSTPIARGGVSGPALRQLRAEAPPPQEGTPPSAAQAATAAASSATTSALAAIDAAAARRQRAAAPVGASVAGAAHPGFEAEREESPRSAPRPHRSSPPVSGAIKTYHPAALGARRSAAARVTPSGGVTGYAARRAAAAAAAGAAATGQHSTSSRQHSTAQPTTPALFGPAHRNTARGTPVASSEAKPKQGGGAAIKPPPTAPPQYGGSPSQGGKPRIHAKPPKLHTSTRAAARDPHGSLRSAQERSAGDAGYARSQRSARAQTRGTRASYSQLVSGRKQGYLAETAAWTNRKGVQGGSLAPHGDAQFASAATAAAVLGGGSSYRGDASAGEVPILGMRESPTPLTPGDMRLRAGPADATWMGMLRAPSATSSHAVRPVWNSRTPVQPLPRPSHPSATPQPEHREGFEQKEEHNMERRETEPENHFAGVAGDPWFGAGDVAPSPVPAAAPSPQLQVQGGAGGTPPNVRVRAHGSPAPSPPDSSGAPSFIDSFVHLPHGGGGQDTPSQWGGIPPPQHPSTMYHDMLSLPAASRFGQAVAAAAAAAAPAGAGAWGAPGALPPSEAETHPYGQVLDASGVSATSTAWGTPARPLAQPPPLPAQAAPAHAGGAVTQGRASLRAAMGNLLATKQKLMATLGRR